MKLALFTIWLISVCVIIAAWHENLTKDNDQDP